MRDQEDSGPRDLPLPRAINCHPHAALFASGNVHDWREGGKTSEEQQKFIVDLSRPRSRQLSLVEDAANHRRKGSFNRFLLWLCHSCDYVHTHTHTHMRFLILVRRGGKGFDILYFGK